MAAIQHLSGIDAVGIQILHVRLENLASAPGSPFGAGHIFYDTANATLKFYDGSVWRDPRARGDHTGTQLANTISNFDTQVRTSRLDQMAAPTAAVAMGSQKITGLATPTTSGDAAEYAWVIGQISSAAAGITSRPPVRAVATANITLSGTQTIDGVSCIAGDRVLVTAQTTASGNGVYTVAAGAWSRATAEDQASEMTAGAMWLVTEGTTYAGTQWRQSTTGPITLGTTSLSIVQFSAAGGYTASNGVQLVSSNFSLKLPASSGLVADTTGVYLDTAIAVRKYAAAIGDGTSTSIAVTHSLGTKDITVSVRNVSTDVAVEVDWTATSTTVATFNFAVAPSTNQYRVVVHG